MADKFEDLRTYVAVISCGGINAAAAELGIAKSAVSRRLSDLETRLGVTLIERTTRKLEPTAVGREYFKGAQDLLAALERLDADPSGRTATEKVTVAAISDVLLHVVAPILTSFRETHPAVAVRLENDGRDADVAIGVGQQPAEARAIGTIDEVLCAAPSYLARRGTPASLAELDAHDTVSIDGATWRFASGASRKLRGGTSAPDATVALALAIAGIGVAQLPRTTAASALAEGTLLALLEDEQPPPQSLWVRVAAGATPSANHLADAIASGFARPR